MFKFAFLALALGALSLGAPAAAQTSSGAAPLSESISGAPADPVAAAEEVDLPPEPDAAEQFYRIRPGDTLTISVLEDPNLTRTVLVRPDGRISLPIAGSVRVGGVSPEDLEIILQERYSRGFQITPTVTVSVRGIAPMQAGPGQAGPEPTRFYVLGAATRRGPFQTIEQLTILEALAVAGGPNPFAAADRIQIRRLDDDGVEEILTFNYEKLEDGEPLENNIIIETGDIIYLPERGLFD